MMYGHTESLKVWRKYADNLSADERAKVSDMLITAVSCYLTYEQMVGCIEFVESKFIAERDAEKRGA